MQGIFFFYICILHIFLHSFSAFVYHFCISLSAFLFLHFRFRSFPLHSAFVILFCFSNPLCQHSSFLILLIRISFQFPFFFLFQDLYIFERQCCIYLYTWINVCFRKFESFFLLPVPGLPAVPIHFRIPLPFIFAFLCRLPSVCRLPLLRVVGRQHSVLAVLSVEHELRLWKKRTLRAFMLFFSFVGMNSLAVLLASLVVTGDFFRLLVDVFFWSCVSYSGVSVVTEILLICYDIGL